MDWIAGLNLFISHDFHPIKCCKFGYSNYLTISYIFLLHVWECTSVVPRLSVGKRLGMHTSAQCTNYMDGCTWCTRSELKAPFDYSKRKRASKGTDKGLFAKTMHCQSVMENAGIKCYSG